MIAALISIQSDPSVAQQILAGQLEAGISGLHVQTLDSTDPGVESQHGMWPGERLHLLVERLLDVGPTLMVVAATPWNMALVLELCQRIRCLAPEVCIALHGAGVAAQSQELQDLAQVDHVVKEPGEAALMELARRIASDGGQVEQGRLTIPEPAQALRGRMDPLVQAAKRRPSAVVVEPAWGSQRSLALHGHGWPAQITLDPAAAAAQISPLLRRGLLVRLADPLLCSAGERLLALLQRLEDGEGKGLLLSVPDEALGEELTEQMCRTGLGRLDLDLSGLMEGRCGESGITPLVSTLAEQGIPVEGVLTYGVPELDQAQFQQGLQRCVASGIGMIRLLRLQVPPGSAYRLQQGVLHAASPPYEVLAHARASHAEIQDQGRFAGAFHLLQEAFKGTGLLRALAKEVGPLLEIVGNFAEGLKAREGAVLSAEFPEEVGELFLDYLDQQVGVDLDRSTKGARFVRSTTLSMHWDSDGRRLITDKHTGKAAHVGKGALKLLDRFGQEQSVQEVCRRLVAEANPPERDKVRQDLRRTVDKLISMSFLVPAQGTGAEKAAEEEPFTSLEEFDYHFRMLADSARVHAFGRAIQQVVKPGQHVIEIGTGTGILAVLAAQAGAQVTAIERFSIISLARAVAQACGVAHRIEFIRGRADLVQLQRPGDVLISEIVGNRILNEGLLEATLDAKQRLLRPGAALIPQALEIRAELCCTDRFHHVSGAWEDLGSRYQVDLNPMSAWFEQLLQSGQIVWEAGADEESVEILSIAEPVVFLDLQRLQSPGFSRTVTLTPLPVISSREVNAVILSFRLVLLPGVDLCTSGMGYDLHWNKPVFMLPRPLRCGPDDPVSVQVSYENHSELRVTVLP